jgi:hypothetical protein
MKKTIAAIALVALTTACTDAEMIQTAHSQCDQIGYPKDSPQYTECVERGFRGTKTAQDAAIAATASAALTGAILSAFW